MWQWPQQYPSCCPLAELWAGKIKEWLWAPTSLSQLSSCCRKENQSYVHHLPSQPFSSHLLLLSLLRVRHQPQPPEVEWDVSHFSWLFWWSGCRKNKGSPTRNCLHIFCPSLRVCVQVLWGLMRFALPASKSVRWTWRSWGECVQPGLVNVFKKKKKNSWCTNTVLHLQFLGPVLISK